MASTTNANDKGIQDAPQAGKRGKNVKGKEVERDELDGEDDELQEKPVRRGRHSGGNDELDLEAGISITAT